MRKFFLIITSAVLLFSCGNEKQTTDDKDTQNASENSASDNEDSSNGSTKEENSNVFKRNENEEARFFVQRATSRTDIASVESISANGKEYIAFYNRYESRQIFLLKEVESKEYVLDTIRVSSDMLDEYPSFPIFTDRMISADIDKDGTKDLVCHVSVSGNGGVMENGERYAYDEAFIDVYNVHTKKRVNIPKSFGDVPNDEDAFLRKLATIDPSVADKYKYEKTSWTVVGAQQVPFGINGKYERLFEKSGEYMRSHSSCSPSKFTVDFLAHKEELNNDYYKDYKKLLPGFRTHDIMSGDSFYDILEIASDGANKLKLKYAATRYNSGKLETDNSTVKYYYIEKNDKGNVLLTTQENPSHDLYEKYVLLSTSEGIRTDEQECEDEGEGP